MVRLKKRLRQMRNIRHPLRYLRSLITNPSNYKNYYGINFFFDYPFVSKWIKDAIYKGFYECDEVYLLGKSIEYEDKALEIGAGIGLTSTVIAKATSKSVHVEANPKLIEAIKNNLNINDINLLKHPVCNLLVHANESSTVSNNELHVGKHFWNASTEKKKTELTETIQVPSIHIEELFKENEFTFMSVDIEGGELLLLEQFKIPQCVSKLMIELHPKVIGLEGTQKVRDLIDAQGFKMIDQSGNSVLYIR